MPYYCTTPSIADHERLVRLELDVPPKSAVHSGSFWLTEDRKILNREPVQYAWLDIRYDV